MIFKIVQILGFASTTMCCECTYSKWSWRPCDSWGENTLKLTVDEPVFGENCETTRLKGTTHHDLLNITSGKISGEGSVNGLPFTYSDPFFCMSKPASIDTNGNEDGGVSPLSQIMARLCAEFRGKSFDFSTPLNPSEIELMESIAGEYKVRMLITDINGDPSKSDCYDFMGIFDCKTDDWE